MIALMLGVTKQLSIWTKWSREIEATVLRIRLFFISAGDLNLYNEIVDLQARLL
jgi:hypothetical protein